MGRGEYRGIGLVEVLWKVIAIIINHSFEGYIKFHNILHGLRSQRGTRKATLEAKLLQHILVLRQEVFYEIFVDIHKAYDALYQGGDRVMM